MNKIQRPAWETIESAVPAITATSPNPDVSEKYMFIPTNQIIDELRNKGLVPVSANQTRARQPGGAEYAKHLVRFEIEGNTHQNIEGVTPQIVLINSHNRQSAFKLMAGMFRAICLNGMIIGDDIMQPVAIRHFDYNEQELHHSLDKVSDYFSLISGSIHKMMGRPMTLSEINDFSRKASLLRSKFSDDTPGNLVRRKEDTGMDLWSTYSRLQENLIKGYSSPFQKTKLKVIKAIDAEVKINTKLWQMATEYLN